MPTWTIDSAMPFAILAGGIGVLLLVHARLQSKLLRRRIASGASTKVVDPATGLFSAAAAWQCIRAEANRALRLGRPLDVWIGTADDAMELDARGRELVFDMPGGAMGIRIDATRVCVLSCAGSAAAPQSVVEELDWETLRIEPGDEAAATALAFVSEVTGG